MKITLDMTPQVCSNCGLTWRGFHQCVPDLRREVERLTAELESYESRIESAKVECDAKDREIARLTAELAYWQKDSAAALEERDRLLEQTRRVLRREPPEG